MIKYNIAKPEKYVKDGVEKTYWATVGIMTEFLKQDGTISRIVEIPAIGLKANIFPIEPKEPVYQKPQVVQDQSLEDQSQYPQDIPF